MKKYLNNSTVNPAFHAEFAEAIAKHYEDGVTRAALGAKAAKAIMGEGAYDVYDMALCGLYNAARVYAVTKVQAPEGAAERKAAETALYTALRPVYAVYGVRPTAAEPEELTAHIIVTARHITRTRRADEVTSEGAVESVLKRFETSIDGARGYNAFRARVEATGARLVRGVSLAQEMSEALARAEAAEGEAAEKAAEKALEACKAHAKKAAEAAERAEKHAEKGRAEKASLCASTAEGEAAKAAERACACNNPAEAAEAVKAAKAEVKRAKKAAEKAAEAEAAKKAAEAEAAKKAAEAEAAKKAAEAPAK